MESTEKDARTSSPLSSTSVPGTGWAHLRVHVPGDTCDCFPRDDNSRSESQANRNKPESLKFSGAAGLIEQLQREFDASDVVIDEYAMVPPEVIDGASFVRPEASKLAISSSLAKSLFKEASLHLKSWLKAESDGAANSYSRESQALTLAATRALLLVSGDHCTAWNLRKRMVAWSKTSNPNQTPAQLLALLELEVHLTTLVFSVRPKATSAWAHRKWVCRLAADAFAACAATAADSAAGTDSPVGNNASAKSSLAFNTRAAMPPSQAAAFWAREVDLCEALARKHPKNYFAWTHRLEVCCKHYTTAEALSTEASRAAAFLARSPSDRAAGHHNEQLLSLQLVFISTPPPPPLLRQDGEDASTYLPKYTARALLAVAVARAQDLCTSQPGHEALWQHLRVVARMRLTHTSPFLRALRSTSRAASGPDPNDNRLKEALAALIVEPIGDVPVKNAKETSENLWRDAEDDNDDDDAIGILAKLLQFAAHVMHGPPPAWAAVEQRRFAASFACFLCVHALKALSPPPRPTNASIAESESVTTSTVEDPSSPRITTALGHQLATSALKLCNQEGASDVSASFAATSPHASEQTSKCASNYSGAGSRHQCLWAALRRDLAQYL